MPSVILECPHCGADKIGFDIAMEFRASAGPPNTARFREFMVCSNCEEVIIGIFDSTSLRYNSPKACPTDPTKLGWHIVNTYPKPQPSKSPTHTPDDLKRIFLQAADAFKRNLPDASGAMSRKVMDVSTQQLVKQLSDQTKTFKTIYDRIEALANNGLLTPDLKDWAHQLRLGGADAAHDLDPFTPEEASELLDFAELYLTYVYSLPGRLKERRERAETEKAAKT